MALWLHNVIVQAPQGAVHRPDLSPSDVVKVGTVP